MGKEEVKKGKRYEPQTDKFLEKQGFHVPHLENTIKLKHAEIDRIAQQKGRTILVEAKNWHRPIDASVIKAVIQKMRKTGYTHGIIVAKQGATEGAEEIAAKYGINIYEYGGDWLEHFRDLGEVVEETIEDIMGRFF